MPPNPPPPFEPLQRKLPLPKVTSSPVTLAGAAGLGRPPVVCPSPTCPHIHTTQQHALPPVDVGAAHPPYLLLQQGDPPRPLSLQPLLGQLLRLQPLSLAANIQVPALKWQCHKIFQHFYFLHPNPSVHLINRRKWFLLKIRFREDIRILFPHKKIQTNN